MKNKKDPTLNNMLSDNRIMTMYVVIFGTLAVSVMAWLAYVCMHFIIKYW